jgi:hypothetical protein
MTVATPAKYVYDFKEVTEALLRQEGISDGLWNVYIEFGIAAANMGPTPQDIRPAAIVPIMKIGIVQTNDRSNLTVDASTLGVRKERKRAVATTEPPVPQKSQTPDTGSPKTSSQSKLQRRKKE